MTAPPRVRPVDVVVRQFAPADAVALADVMWRSVREAARRDYSAEQVRAWLPQPPSVDTVLARTGDGRRTLVACADDRVVGYVDLEDDGHIDHMYCAPEAVGRRVASRLYDEVEQLALVHGIQRLYVEASEAARRVFERKGFLVDERREWELRGVMIHNYAMSKALRS